MAALAQAIAKRIGEPRYKLWFDRHTRFRREGGQLIVGVPNRHFEEWLERTFHTAVAEAAAEVYGEPLSVRFAIDPELFQAARREQAEVQPKSQAKPAAPEPAAIPAPRKSTRQPSSARKTPEPEPVPAKREEPAPAAPSRKTRRWNKLSEFVVGPCNRVAHASALSVIEAPGETANPLVLHGPVGTGKTHLLEGIYAGLRRASRLEGDVHHQRGLHQPIRAIDANGQAGRFPPAVPRMRRASGGRPAFPRREEGDSGRVPAHLRCSPGRRPATGAGLRLPSAAGRRLHSGTGRSIAGRSGVEPDASRWRHSIGDLARQVTSGRRPSHLRRSAAAFLASQAARQRPRTGGGHPEHPPPRQGNGPADRRAAGARWRWRTCYGTR